MKIAHVNLAKGWGGGEIQTLTLVKTLQKIAPETENVLIVRRGGEFARRLANMNGAIPFAEASGFFSAHFAAILKKCDICHAHDGRAPYWCWVHKKLKGVPFAVTRRVPVPISTGFLARAAYGNAARLIALTESIGKTFAPLGKRAEIIASSWLDSAIDERKVSALREQYAGEFVIAHLATLTPVKNHKTTLAAARILQGKGVPARFLILGKGPLEKSLKDASRDLKNVSWLGHKDDVSNYVQAADVVVLPSLEEGLGSSVLEAYHRGKPVVVGNVDGLPEIVTPETGFLHAPEDAEKMAEDLECLRTDSALYEKLSAGALAAAKKYSPESRAEAYLKIYRSLSGSNAAASFRKPQPKD